MSRKLRGVTFMLSVFFAAVIPPHFIGCGCDKLLFFTYFCWRRTRPGRVPVAFLPTLSAKLTIFNGIWSNER